MPVSVAAVTVNDAEPETDPEVAEAIHVPMLTAFARAVAPTEQMEDEFDDQVTELLTSWELPSVSTAFALSCRFVPFAKLAVAGVTWIDLIVAALTFRTDVVDNV